MRFVIVDERELVMWVVNDPSTRLLAEEDVAVWTTAPDFVATQSWLFERAWRAATPVTIAREVHLPVREDAPNPSAPPRASE